MDNKDKNRCRLFTECDIALSKLKAVHLVGLSSRVQRFIIPILYQNF
jgi:hypothetical protein